MSWQTLIAIGSGGFIGAILRAYINGVINRNIAHDLPFGTFGVNILGSLTLGILFAFFTYTQFFSVHMKSLLSTGMMGALTTYSTFALETFWLFERGSVFLGVSNMMINVFGTVIAAGIGFKGFEHILR